MMKHKRRKRKVGDVIFTQTILAASAAGQQHYYWFECPANFRPEDGIPPNAVLHGPFNTQAQVKANERLVLLGEQCEVTEGGDWDPAWDKPQ
jgi:hypothetical protein